MAGLLAETGRTMRQDEYVALTELAALPPGRRGRRCCCPPTGSPAGPSSNRPDSETRVALLERFGLFGVRLATTLIRQGVTDPTTLSTELVRRSGLDELRTVLATQFTERRDLLKARSALLAIDLVLTREPRPAAAPLPRRWSGSWPARTSSWSCGCSPPCAAAAVTLPAEAGDEAERLLGGDGGSAAARLGLEPGTPPDAAARGGAGRADPLAAPRGEPADRARGGRRRPRRRPHLRGDPRVLPLSARPQF